MFCCPFPPSTASDSVAVPDPAEGAVQSTLQAVLVQVECVVEVPAEFTFVPEEGFEKIPSEATMEKPPLAWFVEIPTESE